MRQFVACAWHSGPRIRLSVQIKRELTHITRALYTEIVDVVVAVIIIVDVVVVATEATTAECFRPRRRWSEPSSGRPVVKSSP